MQTREIAAPTPSSTTPVGSRDLGRDEFLRMLITQLKNQDPLDPQDATQFTAQLAQFTSLDQLVSMRSAIEEMARAQTTGQSLSAATLIGRQVLVESDRFTSAGGTPPPLILEAVEASSIASVELVDGVGRVVARSGAFEITAGRSVVDWSRFDRVPGAGSYQVRVNPAVTSAAPRVLVEGVVSGASFLNGSAMLMLGPDEIPISALREVRS